MQGAGNRERSKTDAAGAAMHQQGFVLAYLVFHENVCPYGKCGFGQHRRFLQAVASGQRQGLAGFDSAILRICAAIGKRANFIADGKAVHAFTDGNDFTRQLQTHNRGYPLGQRIFTLALHDIGAVDARVGDSNQNFTRLGLGNRGGFSVQNFDAAEADDIDALHGLGHDGSFLMGLWDFQAALHSGEIQDFIDSINCLAGVFGLAIGFIISIS